MALFHDVTADYVERPRKAADGASALQMSREELKQLHESGLGVADTETTGLKSGENGLTEPAVIRAMTIGEIKAYNREAKRQGLPADQRIPVPRGYADSELRLIALQHFVLPNRPMIHDREDGHELPRGSYNSDRQKAFEYDISAYALGVTGAEVVREKGYGPLTDLKIHGKKVETLPSFVPLMQSFLLFTGKSDVGPKQGVAYFNSPFDIPFLRELFVDAMAYDAAKKNEHRHHERAVNRRLPQELDIDYHAETTTPEQRAKIITHIKKRLLDSGIAQEKMAEYFAPARWHCVLQSYRAAHPELAGHTLDGLMKTAGLAEGDRGAHSAIEDVVLTARGMLHLLGEAKLGQNNLPAMGELPGMILRRSHGAGASSHAAENGRDVVITLPHGKTPHAKAVEHWLRSFNRANPADERDPALNPHGKPWFSQFIENEQGLKIVASGAEKRPLFLSFTKHLGVASHLLDGRYPWLTALEANDKPGTYVDVTVNGEHLHDVPWNILRRNVAYLDKQPASERVEMLKFLRDIGKATDALGGVLLREENGVRYLRLYGHVRQHGTVDIPWPKNVHLADAQKIVFDNLEQAVRLGITPHAVRSELMSSGEVEDDGVQDDDHKRIVAEKKYSSTTLDIISPPDGRAHIHREITPALFQLFKAGLPSDARHGSFNRTIDTVKYGKHYTIAVNKVTHGSDSFITLDGPPEAFDAFVARQKPDRTYEPIAEKPTNILTDAGWLLDRLQKTPGVPKDGVEVTANNRIIVHQPQGISSDALALMHHIGIPHRAAEKEIRFSAGALMQDAFTWSLDISRALKNKAYEKEMGANSIVPSIVKGLKDMSEKGESHKRLDHAKFDPMLGLQLHYKPRSSEAAEIIRIPVDKMLARTLPIGRRRVQRVFARLMHSPKKIESANEEMRWEVTLTPLEQTMLGHALAEVGTSVTWRHNAKGDPCFVITESELSSRGNPIYLAMQTMSDQLATLTESTDVPEWYFSAHPELNGDRIALQLPARPLFEASAAPVYQGIRSYLRRMEHGGAGGDSLNKGLSRIMGERSGKGGSVLKQLDYALRRDSDAQLSILLNVVEQEAPKLQALHKHTLDLARNIAPSDKPSLKRELALNQEMLKDRIWVAHIIAACDAMAEKEPAQAANWMEIRHKATGVADKMAIAIHGADRLREALNTGAHTIANDGSHWRSSLVGASVNARLDILEKVYIEAAQTHTPNLVEKYVEKQRATLEQFGMQQEDKLAGLLHPYHAHAALRLAVLHTVERDPQRKHLLARAATVALKDAYGFAPDKSAEFLRLYETIADPASNPAQCKQAGEVFVAGIPSFNEDAYWLPMQLFGKAKEGDLTKSQRAELPAIIAKEVKKAYHEVGLAHLYLAAEMAAELEIVRKELAHKKPRQAKNAGVREKTLEIGLQHQKSEMLRCYAASGFSTKNAEAELRGKTRAAIEKRPDFLLQMKKHKEFLKLRENQPKLVEYNAKQQEAILRAAITQEGGQKRLEEFYQHKLVEETSLAKQVRAVAVNHPDFEASRAQVNKAAILTAKNHMVAELDDLGKIEYHTRRDLEALGLLLQDMAVKLHPQLEATPIKPQRMDLPEFQGLAKNPIPELRAAAEKLDRLSLHQAKAKISPSEQVTKEEYKQRRIYHSLGALVNKPVDHVLGGAAGPLSQQIDSIKNTIPDYFVLDTSAIIGYFDVLRHDTARPRDTHGTKPDFVGYHGNLLRRLQALAMPQAHGTMPLRIPDYVFYELSGLMPPMLQSATKHFAAIEKSYAPKLEKARGTRHETLLRDKAREYQTKIDDLVDWSIRLDRRRPLDLKSSIGDRVEELNQLFTIFAYHPEVMLPTKVGTDFQQSARVESAVVAGIGMINRPVTPTYYRDEIAKLRIAIAADKAQLKAKPSLANYTLSFNDLLQTPGLDFDIKHLRIHWGQMYFMGLIDEHQYRNFMRNISGAKEANEQGHDNNSRFVTYGSLVNRTKETGLTGSGLVNAVRNARSAQVQDGSKEEMVNRRNLTFNELERFVPKPELDLAHAIGPAKLTMDQCIFGGLLPGAAIKRHREGDEHIVRENDAEVETLRLMARTLGYTPPEIITSGKDRYETLRNSLKHQGFFERQVTLEDCIRLQTACTQADIPCAKLDQILEHLPTLLCEKPKNLVQKKLNDGSVDISAPLERIFTNALVHGALSPAQFVALLVKLDPTSLNVDHVPMCSIKAGGLTLQFKLRKPIARTSTMPADQLAAAIDPTTLWLEIPDVSAPHFDRRQNFSDLVNVGRHARRSGANFSEGQALLDRLLADKFRSGEAAPQQRLVTAHAAFTELFGPTEGDALFFQQMKDFESRQERGFQSGDHVSSTKKPSDCAIAANHRNRLIDRRNKGEVSVVEGTRNAQRNEPEAKLWVIGNDSDLVSAEQYRLLAPETKIAKNGREKTQDPITLGKKCESPGIRLRPPVAAQHSRLVEAQGPASQDDVNIHNVPTRDWLEYVGRLNDISPTAKRNPDDFTHKYAKASVPFRTKFLG